jgi:hypothetical protein
VSRQRTNELLVAIVAAACTAIMGALFWRFGSRTDYWGLLIPALFLVFFISWRSVSRREDSALVVPYSVLMILVSALVLVLDLKF